jgi:hypothetical protein
MKRRTWSYAEDMFLLGLAGDLPMPLLRMAWKAEAAKRGWKDRNAHALRSQIYRLGLATTPVGKWLTVSGMLGLGIHRKTISDWLTRGLIPSRLSTGRNMRYFKRSEVVAFAKREPWRFGGCNADDLFCVLENRELAEWIAAEYPFRQGVRTPVRCLDTGRVWPSAAAAAAAVFCTQQAINDGIRAGRKVVGMRWERVAA